MRKVKPKIRRIEPDPRYQDELVAKFVNNLMLSGKKSTSYKIFYDALDLVAEKNIRRWFGDLEKSIK